MSVRKQCNLWVLILLFSISQSVGQTIPLNISKAFHSNSGKFETQLEWQMRGIWIYEVWMSESVQDPNWIKMGELKSPGTQKDHVFKLGILENKTQSFYKVTAKTHPLNEIDFLDLGDGIRMELARIPEGNFVMGVPEASTLPSAQPQTNVTLTKPFLMSVHEITQKQWQQVMRYNPSNYTGENHPVDTVVWWAADAFCRILTERGHRNGAIPHNFQITLPTEAQWEYACRAGTQTRFHFGDDLDETLLVDYAWYVDNARVSPQDRGTKPFGSKPVGSKLPNQWGLFDMHGNVAEYCLDWNVRHPGGNVMDPVGTLNGFRHTFRGGHIFNIHSTCQSAARGSHAPGQIANPAVGFRIVVASAMDTARSIQNN